MHEIISRKAAKARGDTHYFTGKVCPNGHTDLRHVSSYCCVSCGREWTAKERATNPEYRAKQNELCRVNNSKRYYADPVFRDKTNKLSAARYKRESKTPEGKVAQAAWGKAWRERNPDKVRQMGRNHRANNPEQYAFKESLRACIKRIKKLKNPDFKVAALGYSRNEFYSYMESLFLPGMTWDNHGEWEIDHKRPVIAFIKEGNLDLSVIHALSNLQPLWATDNRRKSGKF